MAIQTTTARTIKRAISSFTGKPGPCPGFLFARRWPHAALPLRISGRRCSQSGRAGRASSLRRKFSLGVCAACAPRVICCVDRRKLRGVSTEPRGAMRLSRQGFAASITEAAKLKTGANSSPSRVAPGPVPRDAWVSRALLAPNVRSRSMCRQTTTGLPGPFEFRFLSSKLRRRLSRVSSASHSNHIP